MSVTRSDSAGIELVQIANLDSTTLERWRVDSVPITIIGDDQQGEEHVFELPISQLRMSDGRVIVALRTDEIREFDSSGTFLRRIARPGGGPGEFRDLGGLERIHADTLLAYQRYPARVVLFAPDGKYVSTHTVVRPGMEGAQAEFAALNFKSAFQDGTLLVSRHPGTEHGGELGKTWVDSVRPQRLDREGKLLGDFGVHWDHDESRVVPMSPPPPDKRHLASLPSRPRASVWSSAGKQLFYSPRDRFEIALHDQSGKLVRIVRMATQTVRRTLADSLIREVDGVRFDYGATYPDTLPALVHAEGDVHGNIWVHLDPRSLPGGAPQTLVLDPTGKPIALATLPAAPSRGAQSWRLFANKRDIGDSHVTSVAIDPDERAYVLVLGLNKQPARQK